jgi:hypothetical protein
LAVYRLLSQIKGSQAGYIGIASFSALPLMAQNASGLGFEIANLLMLSCTMIGALSYCKCPKNPQLGFFLFSTILLAHTRYESALYALPAGLIILSKWIQLRRISIPLPGNAKSIARSHETPYSFIEYAMETSSQTRRGIGFRYEAASKQLAFH